MKNLNTKNQSKDKIVSIDGYSIGSFTCYNADNDYSANIQLTSLEEMWYGHEENIDHPEGSEYPVSINVPHMKVMRERVADSVFNRTGIDIRDFDSIIHATTCPGKDKQGNIIDHGHENIIRNVQV
tara:strand:+ start:8790 stop:9167 length:378 start_codon:yes stop_codon:yes gene_type:complete